VVSVKRLIDAAIAVTGRRWLGWLVTAGCVAGFAGPVRAEPVAQGDAVALLPFDADRSLELYGQPVASEIARALVAGAVQVVVVGPRMAVPERARLIIDGTIALGKASAITISIRIRNTLDGKVLDTLSATAPGLAKLDGAAAELSARILPIVRDRLAAQHPAVPDDHDHDHGHVVQTPRLPDTDRTVLIAVADARPASRDAKLTPLAAALDTAVGDWTRAHHRLPQKIDASKLDPKIAAKAVVAGATDLAIGFWVLDYQPEPGELAETRDVPMARGRVRVRIADASAVVFDRVIATDTVLGDRKLGSSELAARVAREVLAILRPHMLRHVRSWE
jgi:hypothetical protein